MRLTTETHGACKLNSEQQGSSINHNMSTPTRTSVAAPSSHIKTRFLIISDTHSSSPTQNDGNDRNFFCSPLPKADVLLHCGDMTMVGHLHEYEKTLNMLESIDADLKLVIAGNHDISLDAEYYARKGQYMHRRGDYDIELPQKAINFWKGERAQRAGVVYLEEGTHMFTLKNGAKLRVCRCVSLKLFTQLTS